MSLKFLLFVTLVSLPFLLFCACQTENEYYYPDILNVGFIILNRRVSDFVNDIDLLNRHLREYDGDTSWRFDILRLSRIYEIPYDIPKRCEILGKYAEDINVTRATQEKCEKDFLAKAGLLLDFQRQINRTNEHINDIIGDYFQLKSSPYGPTSSYIYAPNLLYEYITGTCENYNASMCFIHRIGGSHLLQNVRTSFRPTWSLHQEVYLAYLKIGMALLKGHASQIYRYLRENDAGKKIAVSKATFASHTSHIAKLVRSALKIAPRDIRPGDAPTSIEGKTYIRLKWFVEQYIVNEANLNPTATCSNKCEDYAIATFYEYGNVPANGSDVCYGVIYSCYYQPLGQLCPTIDEGYRRYEGIQGTRNLGNTYTCSSMSNQTKDLYYVKSGLFNRCDVCTCVCDDHANPKSVRTFSLRKVTSDVINNMVITGLRLREINSVIYIQIQQGQLIKPGVINKSTVHWVLVETFNASDFNVPKEDYYKLHYLFERGVSLHTVGTNENFVRDYIRQKAFTDQTNQPENIPSIDSYVMTGIKFGVHYYRLNIAVQFKAVNMKTGKLILDNKWDGWIINEESPARFEINIDEPHVSTLGPEENIEVVGESRYVKFRPSDNVKDFGQTTVPFLDSQEVVSNPPIPLSGAGIYYKGQPGYGGFIGLKLISYDFSQFVPTELAL